MLTGSTSCRAAASEAPAESAENLGVAPFASRRAGAELALDHPLALRESLQHVTGHRGTEPETGGGVGDRERTVGAGIPADQVGQRIVDGFDERGGNTDG